MNSRHVGSTKKAFATIEGTISLMVLAAVSVGLVVGIGLARALGAR